MTTEDNASAALVLLRSGPGGGGGVELFDNILDEVFCEIFAETLRELLCRTQFKGFSWDQILYGKGVRGAQLCLPYPFCAAGCWFRSEIRGVSSRMHHCMIYKVVGYSRL